MRITHATIQIVQVQLTSEESDLFMNDSGFRGSVIQQAERISRYMRQMVEISDDRGNVMKTIAR